jgi:cytochrome c-type biogenesis protein CcmH/NrfF
MRPQFHQSSLQAVLMRNRVLHVALLLAASLTMLGAGSSTTTLDRINHKLMCPCGCAEILGECNHVGCPDSGPMINELRKDIADGQTEPAILNAFVAEYGPVVLAAPLRGGFDVVAWVVPFAVLVLGGLGILLALRRWRRHTQLTTPDVPQPTEDVRERIRRDTE